jgi:glycosyltransferase involved in cell wall biosynthesis
LDRFPEIMPSGIARLYYRIMMRAATGRSASLIVPSNSTKQDLLDFYHVPEERVRVIPMGVDLETFRPSPCSESVGADNESMRLIGSPTILYVGTSHPHKNLCRLMRAIRQMVAANPVSWKTLKLVCVGPFTRRFPKPSDLARQESISSHVVETGEISDADLVALMRISSVFVLPSLSEGFGLPALEAMACGLPMLLSSIPALRETAGEAAEYFNPTCEEDLVDRLRYLLENSTRRATLIGEGLSRVARFSWGACAEATVKVYERVRRSYGAALF